MIAILLAAAAAADPQSSILSEDPAFREIERSWGFSDAAIRGDTIYLSGVVVRRRAADAGLEAAYGRAFEQIGRTLARAGAGWSDVVDITSFHTDLQAQMPAMVAVKNRFIHEPFPAWTAVQVVRLIPDDGVTEIKIVARRRR